MSERGGSSSTGTLGDALPDIWALAEVIERHPTALGCELAEHGRVDQAIEGMLAGGATVDDILGALVLHGDLDRLPSPGALGEVILRAMGYNTIPYARTGSRQSD